MNQHNPFMPKTITGTTVQLEPLHMSHYEPLKHAANDARIWSYMPQRADGAFFDDWFEACLQDDKQMNYAIRNLKDNTIVGSRAYYDIEKNHKRLEIGMGWLMPSVWGTHFNHESLCLFFGNAFEQWQMNRVQISTDPRNKRSYNALKKLGGVEEGTLRQHMLHHNGLLTDTVIFSILATEWPRVKAGLMDRLRRCQ